MLHRKLVLRGFAVALACSWAAFPAGAVVINSGDGSGNTTAPPDSPGWDNMAQLAHASAIYLGNRWMITASHVIDRVGNSPVTLTDGRVFQTSAGSDVVLRNPSELQIPSTMADLKMFRLAADPGLPTMQIGAASPAADASVMMIGAGRNREPDTIGWSVSSSVWTPTDLASADASGFALDLYASQMRWGTNRVESGGTISNGNTMVFGTRFDSAQSGASAQAVAGDSGGGVFQLVDGEWQLAGVIDTIQFAAGGQPSGTVVFGDRTFAADLAQYRDEIEGILHRPDSAWQNPVNCFDVDRSGSVNAHDVLWLINSLQNGGVHALGGTAPATDLFVDVNGDNTFDLLDLSQLINMLEGSTENLFLRGSSDSLVVAEPSTGLLTLLAVICALVARGASMGRRISRIKVVLGRATN